ncbi:MAG TPA: YihY/virulence factor BrkB family protein [Actinomycetota bacterium]|jgi:membrane protein|nr:YihY/virulence factor BrkB family protein [Actinomycetota bacterium]
MQIVDRLPGPARAVVRRAREDDILLFASSLAFYAVVSLIPLVIVVLWIVGLFVGDEEVKRLAATVRDVAPEKLGVDRALVRVARLGTGIGLPAVAAALWPATAYGAGLKRAFESLSSRGRKEMRGLRGRGLAILVLLPLFVLGGLLGAYGAAALTGDTGVARVLGWALALPGAFIFVVLVVGLIYRVFAPEAFGAPALWRGAAACALGVAILSVFFTIYLGTAANFQERYATSGLAALVLLALWLFLANVLLLVGYKVALESG